MRQTVSGRKLHAAVPSAIDRDMKESHLRGSWEVPLGAVSIPDRFANGMDEEFGTAIVGRPIKADGYANPTE